jgi:hypothetical protein
MPTLLHNPSPVAVQPMPPMLPPDQNEEAKYVPLFKKVLSAYGKKVKRKRCWEKASKPKAPPFATTDVAPIVFDVIKYKQHLAEHPDLASAIYRDAMSPPYSAGTEVLVTAGRPDEQQRWCNLWWARIDGRNQDGTYRITHLDSRAEALCPDKSKDNKPWDQIRPPRSSDDSDDPSM